MTMNQQEAIAPSSCRCRTLQLVPRENPDGTRSDRWLCATCNLDFGNVKLAIPPRLQPASDAEIDRWGEDLHTAIMEWSQAEEASGEEWRKLLEHIVKAKALMRRAAPPSSGRLLEAAKKIVEGFDCDDLTPEGEKRMRALREAIAAEPQDARSVSTDIGVDDYRMRLLDAVEERNEARTQLATAHNETREARKDRDAARKELAEAVRKHNEVRDELAALRANPQPRVAVPKRLQQALSNMQARLKAFDNDLSPIGSSEERRIFMEIIGATESLVEAVESLDAAAQRRVVVEPEPPQPIAELQRLLDEMREARGTFGPFAPGLEQVRAVIDALAKRAGAK